MLFLILILILQIAYIRDSPQNPQGKSFRFQSQRIGSLVGSKFVLNFSVSALKNRLWKCLMTSVLGHPSADSLSSQAYPYFLSFKMATGFLV